MVAADVVQAPNKQQLAPMLDKVAALPRLRHGCHVARRQRVFSEANVNACAAAGIEPVTAMGREAHLPTLEARFVKPPPPPKDPTPLAAMDHRLQMPDGKTLTPCASRSPEPVFGIIKSVLGFRQFLLRGLDNVRGEWTLVTMAWNMKRMFALAGAN